MPRMRPILRSLLRRRKGRVARGPIIFDFKTGQAYRATAKDLADTVKKAVRRKRVVKRVEGVPPQVILPPK